MQLKTLTGPLAFHAVARAHYPLHPFDDHAYCVVTWNRLRRLFPHCYAAVLMPNHVHLVLKGHGVTAESLRQRLQHFFHDPELWERVPMPQAIPDASKLRRQVRYVHLNPSRKIEGTDPLSWEWSTHLDYMEAVAEPWPETGAALRALGFSANGRGRVDFHRYISSDPAVHALGTPAPPTPAAKPVILDLTSVERSAEIVHRTPRGYFRRRSSLRAELFTLLKEEWHVPAAAIAAHFGVHHSAVKPRRRRLGLPRKPWLTALHVVLSDPRLLQTRLSPRPS